MAYAALELHRVGVTIDRVTEACHAVEVRKLTGPGLGILDTYFGVSAALMAPARKNSTLGSERGSDNHARGSGTIRQRQRSHAASHDFPKPQCLRGAHPFTPILSTANDCRTRAARARYQLNQPHQSETVAVAAGQVAADGQRVGRMLAAQPYTFRGGDGELQPQWGLSGGPVPDGWGAVPDRSLIILFVNARSAGL